MGNKVCLSVSWRNPLGQCGGKAPGILHYYSRGEWSTSHLGHFPPRKLFRVGEVPNPVEIDGCGLSDP
jgi:hypothetical protein